MPVNTWEKLGTASVTGSVANTSWKELGRTTLSSNGDSIDVTSLATKDNLMVLCHTFNTGGAAGAMANQFNGDTGSNYAERRSTNGGSDVTSTGATGYNATSGEWNSSTFHVSDILNIAAQEKLIITSSAMVESAGAGNEPRRQEAVAKWANTSAQINRINIKNSGAGDFASGSEVVVLGYDNDEADSGSNFWQELASVELGSSSGEISSGTITAKKYLWVQIRQEGTANNVGNISLRFNNDTGSNYASRFSTNGGGDNTTKVSQTSLYMHDDAGDDTKGSLHNIFIINKADKEKLIISETVQNTATGAGTAPARSEEVGKWANTSNQITEIDVFGLGGGSFASGSYIKVYGAD